MPAQYARSASSDLEPTEPKLGQNEHNARCSPARSLKRSERRCPCGRDMLLRADSYYETEEVDLLKAACHFVRKFANSCSTCAIKKAAAEHAAGNDGLRCLSGEVHRVLQGDKRAVRVTQHGVCAQAERLRQQTNVSGVLIERPGIFGRPSHRAARHTPTP